eukprot:4752595-Prymnesium_polylepis.1
MEEAAEHIAKLAANTTTLTAQLKELTIKHEKSVEQLAKAHSTLSEKVGDMGTQMQAGIEQVQAENTAFKQATQDA